MHSSSSGSSSTARSIQSRLTAKRSSRASRCHLFMVHAWQDVDDFYKEKEQQHGRDLSAKQRSQQELESLSMPGCWPSEGLKCLLRDGSQIDMFEGLQRLLVGMHVAGLDYAFVSASSSVSCC